ncbi:TPA: flagellin lysine-N-methylase [Bacillus thuringiensis]|nr:flagellin lysine-N-methylase [Bacillus cereus]HDR4798611.1 flagellin lysine-N-methylase [Bacillus cereus]HDR4804626.1 flagellin lysine-N-methylase [Bacillus cereus]HDR4810565.1 flagellin lysine-N-methylase [Bacillus cereus]HDR4833030.1 flagellin lysine-N-methylase [Bacillus cereus]
MKKNGYIANYLSQFNCIGSNCEDNCCCSNWTVHVDREHFEVYSKMQDKELFNNKSRIIKNKNMTSEEDYGIIEFDSTNKCTFLTEDKLCKIHMVYGQDLLCNVCKVYPKITKKVNDTFFQTAQISCPEIARLVLLSKNPPKWNLTKDQSFSTMNTKLETIENSNYTKKINEIVYNIMQQREYSLSKRLWLISIFIEELSYLTTQKNINGKQKSINHALKKSKEMERYFPINYIDISLELLIQGILRMRDKIYKEFNKEEHQRLKECLDLFIEGIDIKNNLRYSENRIVTYKKAYEKFYKSYVGKYDYIFENYCLYYFQHYLFPYKLETLPNNFMNCILDISILRFILFGISASSIGVTQEIVIQLFQSFSKLFYHNEEAYKSYILQIYNQLYAHYPKMNMCVSILLSQ